MIFYFDQLNLLLMQADLKLNIESIILAQEKLIGGDQQKKPRKQKQQKKTHYVKYSLDLKKVIDFWCEFLPKRDWKEDNYSYNKRKTKNCNHKVVGNF